MPNSENRLFGIRRARCDGPSAVKFLLASSMSVLKLALSRTGNELDRSASIPTHSGLTVPGSCSAVSPAAAAVPA